MPWAPKTWKPQGQSVQKPVDARPSAAIRGYDRRWRIVRRMYLRRNPLCVECAKHGRTEASTVVDHIEPHRGDEKLFWDERNWQALCKPCHDQKTARGL